MQYFLFALVAALAITAAVTGVVYVTNEPDKASIAVDKVRLEEVKTEATEAVKKVIRGAEETTEEIRENIQGERQPPTGPATNAPPTY